MSWFDFDYAVIRLVPCAHRNDGVGIGLVMHSPSGRFLRARFAPDISSLATLAPGLDLDRVALYLRSMEDIASGNSTAIGSLTLPERFHWLTAPRSDVLQPCPIHPGRTEDLEAAFERIFEREIRVK